MPTSRRATTGIADQWTAPLNAGFSKVFTLGKQPMSFALNGTYYLASPKDGPVWGVQSTVSILLPTKKH